MVLALGVMLTPWMALAQPTPPVPSGPVAGGPTADARVHFERGLVLFGQQDHLGALAEFQRAYELSHRPSVLFNLGVTYQALHRYPQAAAAIEEYLARADGITPERRAEVEQALQELRGFIAHIRLRVTPIGATVTLDGEAVPSALLSATGVPVGSGEHTVEVSAPGHNTVRRSVRIASGEIQDLAMDLPVTVVHAVGIQPATVVLRGVPDSAVATVDGRRVQPTGPLHLSPGVHRFSVTLAGIDPWTQDLAFAPGVSRTITTHMRATPRLYHTLFVTGLIATGALAVSAVVFGALTESTHADFVQRYQGDPNVAALSSQGLAYRFITNTSLIAAGLAAIGTTVTFVLDRSVVHSTADISFAPTPEGAMGRLRVTF